jgi:hypothetical protein
MYNSIILWKLMLNGDKPFEFSKRQEISGSPESLSGFKGLCSMEVGNSTVLI